MNLIKKFTILFVPVSSIGHVNSCIGVAETMHSRGHRIVFAVDQSFKGQFIKRGFEEEIIEKQLSLEEQRNPSGQAIKVLTENGLFDDHPPVNKVKMFIRCLPAIATSKDNQILAKIIHRVKPDVIVIDWFVVPSIVKSGIPWVNLVSLQILTLIDDPRTPPKWLGLPSDDPSQWDKYRELVKDDFDFMKNKFYHHLFGDEKPFPLDRFIESPYLNIYSYPLELDYIDKRPLPQAPKWHRFDSFIRMKEEKFDLPEKLACQKGKLIFLSMGSLGTAHVKLMKRLISLIGDLPFRFIVSKGVYGDQYDLPSNCWGDKMVPQIKVLPKVDLVITHGGNNTVTESFYFGKPMIIMPLYVDQFDNAQRVHEKGFGLRLNAHRCTKEELNDAINKLIYDDELLLRMKKIAERVQSQVKSGKVGELIENLVIDFNNNLNE